MRIFGSELGAMSEDEIVTRIHDYMLSNYSYVADEGEQWAQVADTIALQQGDCEDLANVEASLLIAAFKAVGMHDEAANVSVVAGQMTAFDTSAGHALVQYRDQNGHAWALDATDRRTLGSLDAQQNSHLLFENVQQQYGFNAMFRADQTHTVMAVNKAELVGFTTATHAGSHEAFIRQRAGC